MTYKHTIALTILLLSPIKYVDAHLASYRNCIMLFDRGDSENVGTDRFFLMTRVQSAIAEKNTPILMSSSLLNSFFERKIYFQQNIACKKHHLSKTDTLYSSINERMQYWSNYYNTRNNDIIQNKKLVLQQINNEFYNNKKNISPDDYQNLLIFVTEFDLKDWNFYTNNGGFYLLIPKNYSSVYPLTGFKTDSLTPVTEPDDTSYIYLSSQAQKSLADSLGDFFLTLKDFDTDAMPYSWNIVTAGHGGWTYNETNKNNIISWSGEPIINDLTLIEFKKMLQFFNDEVNTHFFSYSSCYGGGNHFPLIFNDNQNSFYNYPIICDTLTDCTSYCKWETLLPSCEKEFLSANDIIYDKTKQCWQLYLRPVYHWNKFFKNISTLDFSTHAIEKLQTIMPLIVYSSISNIPSICLANTHTFFPLQGHNTIKINDELLCSTQNNDNTLNLTGIKTILLESTKVLPTIVLSHQEPLRIVSIKPDNSLHYIKKLECISYLDVPSAFWQAPYQRYNKLFIIDECTFTAQHDFHNIESQSKKVTLNNIIIFQQKSQYMRILCTINDTPTMIIAHKTSEENDYAIVQEIVTMTEAAQQKYNQLYQSLKTTIEPSL